jgi:chromosome segregation ATPase
MAQASPTSPRPADFAASPIPLAGVRLEQRHASGRVLSHEVTDVGFLIGSVPGCDLRLPGAELPPVMCLITRHVQGASVRKLVPTYPILVNGETVTSGLLRHGDRLTLGAVDLSVQIQEPIAQVSGSAEKKKHSEAGQRPAPAAEPAGERRQDSQALYRQQRDRIAGLREAARRAARRVKEQKLRLDEESAQHAVRAQEQAAREAHLESRESELARARDFLDEQRRQLGEQSAAWEEEQAKSRAECSALKQQFARDRETLDKTQAQYQADLVRLDRLQVTLDQRRQQLQERACEVDKGSEQLQRTSRELEEQARKLDEWHEQLHGQEKELARKKAEQDKAGLQLAQRIAGVEGQQAMLASLRTRLERMRDELRQEQQRVIEQRTRLEASEAEVQQRAQEAQGLQAELEGEKLLRDEEIRGFEERRTTMEAAVNRLRQVQEALDAKEQELDKRAAALDVRAGELAQEADRQQAQSTQLVELQQRVATDREVIREREASLAQAEQVREALQEQLRRRSEELAVRQRELAEYDRQQAEETGALEARRVEIEDQRRQAEENLAAARGELDGRAAELTRLQAESAARDQQIQGQVERVKEAGRTIGEARKALSEERVRWEAGQKEAAEAAARSRDELEKIRREVVELREQFPELELRAQAAGERLAQARVQLREHLNEMHGYARQSQEDVETLRTQAQSEAEQVQKQRLALHQAREEHRLAVAAFRQQLIEWQGQVADMKRSLAHGETRLERRQAQVNEQARQIDVTSNRLAQQEEKLHEQEREVAEQREDMERHLNEMREWYRHKLRELSERRRSPTEEVGRLLPWRIAGVFPAGGHPASPAGILPMTEELDPGDRKLGELLRSLDLVDLETLASLLTEARRQHRSLRQALLGGGYLTLYQMALIETGNLDGLVLGRLRTVDRLRATPCETVYRVFDPQRGQEAILRHLAEAEMHDAVHPDEFRQRFAQAAAIPHDNLAATYEMLEIGGRPAVLQEWLTGLLCPEWVALAAAPGVWLRLLGQAALALHAIHQASATHGHIQLESFLLTGDGVLKLCGLGEPQWLRGQALAGEDESSTAADLVDLGLVAAAWAGAKVRRKNARAKSFPAPFQAILNRLTAKAEQFGYPDTAALLEDIEQAQTDSPAHVEAWQHLMQHVRQHLDDVTEVRQSA